MSIKMFVHVAGAATINLHSANYAGGNDGSTNLEVSTDDLVTRLCSCA